jgi:hypothetical protein
LNSLLNKDWNDFPSQYKYGTFIKRELYEKEGYNPIEQVYNTSTRKRCVAKSFKLEEEHQDLLLSEFWI